MTRRRLVALVSASVILGVTLLVALALVMLTQTDYGRERFVRRLVQAQLASSMGERGSIHVGKIGGSLFTGVVVDTFAIRDEEDSLFVSTGRIAIGYDPRDLLDRRLLLSRLEVEHPFVHLRRHADGVWNFKRIFPPGPDKPRTSERRFGDYIVLDSVVINDGTVVLTEPWKPDTFLTRTQRDSAIRAALESQTREIRQTAEGLKRTSRWTELDLIASFARLADPDTVGQAVHIEKLDVAESDPPFVFSNLRGPVRIVNDTVWLDIAHFDLPASTGRAKGLVTWKGKGPTRYDVHIWGDSVALNDINWVYPTLPREGGGRLELHIRNEPATPRIIDYAITNMDMRSTGSHLRGDMTFGVGGSMLIIKDVALAADPLDFDLIRTLNGEPFPVDWQGTLTGTVRARGGPVNRWQMDDLRFVFRDKHVPGAISRGSGRGGLDIEDPGDAVFRGFALTMEQLDLRTPRYLFPDFPRLQGVIAGRALLDSIWTDVRFSDADVTHTDGETTPTRALGSGRITLEEPLMRFDVDLDMQPLSFTTMAKSYPMLPVRGAYRGPLRVSGTMDDLTLASTLAGPAGTIAVDGRFDFNAPGFGAAGRGEVTALDVRELLGRSTLPSTRLTATFTGDVRGDSLANLAGTAVVAVERSSIDSVRVYPSAARLAFGGGKVLVDSLRLETSLATLRARGALGLAPGISDSLTYTVSVDSLGALRDLLDRPARTIAAAVDSAAARAMGDARADGANGTNAADGADGVEGDDEPAPMLGILLARGTLSGYVDSLETQGQVTGSDFLLGASGARQLVADYHFVGIPDALRGRAGVRLDTVLVSGVALRSVRADVSVLSPSAGTLGLTMESANDVTGGARVAYAITGDTTHVRLDTLGLDLPSSHWTLIAPASFASTRAGLFLDSLAMRNTRGGKLNFYGALPRDGALTIEARVDSLPLGDVGALAQLPRNTGGLLSLNLDVAGQRQDPSIDLTATGESLSYGDLRLPQFLLRGSYNDRRAHLYAQLRRDGVPALIVDGSLPVDLALVPGRDRLLNDTLSGVIRADSIDLGLLETMTPELQRVKGVLSTQVQVGGTYRSPTFTGRFGIADGDLTVPELGIRLRDVQADVALGPDSIAVRRFSASSGSRPGTASLTGLVRLQDFENPVFDLTFQSRGFQIIQRRELANLEVTGRLRLQGPLQHAALDGDITIDRGAIFLPDQAQKNLADISDPEFRNVVDTTVVANRGVLPQPPSRLVENLQVANAQIRLGDDVWLRSEEANIKLVGELDVDRQLARARRAGVDSLEAVLGLAGTLGATRGTYRLDLGPVQRTFQVDSGSIRFFGNPDIPPALDIWASYTVRQANREDVHIIANIGGTLLEPRLNLTSSERIPLSYTEILSYLVFGQPSFVVGGSGQNTLNQVTSVLLPTIGGVLERALSESFAWLDVFQVQTGNPQQTNIFSQQGVQELVSGAGITAGKQISERTFLSATGTLCRPNEIGNAGQSWSLFLGFSIEHRLNYGVSVVASVEPGGVNPCTRLPGDATPRRQVGFDLFREWRF